jgi:hypothetical protein
MRSSFKERKRRNGRHRREEEKKRQSTQKTSRRRTRRGVYGLAAKRPSADISYDGGHASKGTSTTREKDSPIKDI